MRGFVLNKLRGDPALLDPAPRELERMTGVPVVGVIPWLRHQLPDEDGAARIEGSADADAPTVAVVRYPTASNLDEFKPLEQAAKLRWAWEPGELASADLVVLPGSKHVASDIAWLRDRGFDRSIRRRLERGGRVLGICGGLQMLGERIEDREGAEGGAEGLGLLPLVTRFHPDKLTRPTEARFKALPAPWNVLSGVSFTGYEIRHGRTAAGPDLSEAIAGGLGYVDGPVLAVYVHGMFEETEVLTALFGISSPSLLDDAFDEIADAVEASIDFPAIERLAGE